MVSSNAYRADSPSAHHYSGQHYSTLPEALYSLSCLSDLYEIGNVLGAEVDSQELREHILIHLRRAICAQGACLLLYHAAQQRFIPVASVGEKLPTAELIATIDWRVIEQQTLRGPGEMLATLLLDDLYIVLVTLSYNVTGAMNWAPTTRAMNCQTGEIPRVDQDSEQILCNNRLLGIVALSVTDNNALVDERGLLLTFMGRVAALLLYNYDLSNRIRQDAINQERNRIARELHDGITQQITHVLHKLEYIQRLIEMGSSQFILSELHHVRNILNNSLHDLRNTMSGLSSVQVEKGSLVKVIRQIGDQYKSSHPETELVLEITGLDESQHLPPHLPSKIEMLIFHCIQEALTNVWKHAQATSVHVQLRRLASWLVVEVTDNGLGFQPEQVFIASKHGNVEEQHFGLAIMRERIEEARGFWELQSKPGEGTTIRARFPLANPNHELTKREHEILQLISQGLTNREIARRLKISVDTVKAHVHRIMQKLGVKDRVQAVAVAYRNGLL